MKTLRVQWAEGAIEQAVQRLTTIVNETSTDATHTIVGRPLSWMDLACLLDFVRQCDGDHAPVYKKLLALMPDKEWDVEPPSLGEVVDAVLQERAELENAAQLLRHGRAVLEWLHAEAVWHAEHHRAQLETQGLPLALLRKGVPELLKQVDAQGRRIREQDEELALHREREALTRKALKAEGDGLLQFVALRVRQQRDRAMTERDEAVAALTQHQELLTRAQHRFDLPRRSPDGGEAGA